MDEAKKTKAQVEWARLESKERAGGVPTLTLLYKYCTGRLWRMLETIGELTDRV